MIRIKFVHNLTLSNFKIKTLFVFILILSGCNEEEKIPVTGTWRCVAVIKDEASPDESAAKAFGVALAKSGKESDSLIFAGDGKYEQRNSAFGVFNMIKGTYIYSAPDKKLTLTKNEGERGNERQTEYSIKKFTSDTLLLKDRDGFDLLYLRQK